MKKARGVTNFPAPPSLRALTLVSRLLLVAALVLAFCILAGTVYALYRGPGTGPAADSGTAEQGPGQRGNGVDQDWTGVFTGIGRLRIPVAAHDGAGKAILILSIAFPYPPGDRAFAEELASRVGDFRRIATEYISSRTTEELRNQNEEKLKAELLRRYNEILMLGNLETLYFNDLMVFE